MIRFAFRWLFRLVVLLVVLVVGLILAKDILVREWVAYRLRTVTGLETRLDGARAHFLAGSISLTGVQLYNSADFGGGPLLSAPEIHLELDTDALARREYRLRLARLHVSEFSLVRNTRGETNIYAIADHARRHANLGDAVLAGPPGLTFTGIDTLNLTFGTLRLVDLGIPGASRDFRVGLTNEILRNVRSEADLTPLLLRVLFREAASGLKDLFRGGDPPVAPTAPLR